MYYRHSISQLAGCVKTGLKFAVLTVQEVHLGLVPLKLGDKALDLLKVVQRVGDLARVHGRHDVALRKVLLHRSPQLSDLIKKMCWRLRDPTIDIPHLK